MKQQKPFTQKQRLAIAGLEKSLKRMADLGLKIYGVDWDLVVVREEAVDVVNWEMDNHGEAIGGCLFEVSQSGGEYCLVNHSDCYIDSCAT